MLKEQWQRPHVMTPREIVSELDRYIVGQHDAKRAVAIALRNRWRRQNVAPELRDEIAPKNILMIGPTGVGKTEIARRLARLAQAPFVKVEASRYTEVGYVGRDVESMIRDLAEIAVKMVREEERERRRGQGARERRGAPARHSVSRRRPRRAARSAITPEGSIEVADTTRTRDTREKLRKLLRDGNLDDREVEIEVSAQSAPMVEVLHAAGHGRDGRQHEGAAEPDHAQEDAQAQKVKVPEALELLTQEEAARLVDMENVAREAIHRAEQSGIVFIDEIDKIAGREAAARPRRLARGRAARPAADRRGLDRQHQVRRGAHRPHPVRRLGRVSHLQAVGPDSRVPGPLSDSRRAGSARPARTSSAS